MSRSKRRRRGEHPAEPTPLPETVTVQMRRHASADGEAHVKREIVKVSRDEAIRLAAIGAARIPVTPILPST